MCHIFPPKDLKEKEGGAKPDLVEQAVTYVLKKSYPENCTENEKRVIRKKSKKFVVQDGKVFYKKTIKGKVRHPIIEFYPCFRLMLKYVIYSKRTKGTGFWWPAMSTPLLGIWVEKEHCIELKKGLCGRELLRMFKI